MLKSNFLAISLLVSVSFAGAGNKQWTVYSPDKNITLNVMLEDSQLLYNVELNSKRLVDKSPLGINLEHFDFSDNIVSVAAEDVFSGKFEYETEIGKSKSVATVYNSCTFALENSIGETMNVLFRVANDGVAFAYQFDRPFVVLSENTGFSIPVTAKSFLTPLASAKSGWCRTNPSYENHYHFDAPVDFKSDFGDGWIFPALFNVENAGWILLTESGTDSNYAACHLSEAESGLFKLEFPTTEHNLLSDPVYVVQKSMTQTPWRVMILGDKLADIVESTFMNDLVRPVYDATTAVKPGLATWSWLVYNDSWTTYDGTKAFIDMAATLKLPYCLIDAVWDTQIGRDKIEELAEYADSKNVDLLLWYNSNGNWNDAKISPLHLMNNSEVRKKEMAWLKSIGIKGIKVDFFGGDKQNGMKLYEDILRDANYYGLYCIFHGCTLPRGWERMYPNYVSSEAVLGQEFCKSEQPNEDKRPKHCTVLPFTRNVVAPMDFTPVVLNEYLGEKNNIGSKRRTTAAFELALPVIFYSPITHLGIIPDNLKEFPVFVWNYISSLPTVWDETSLLSGYPGKDVVMARKKDGRWFVAGINGEDVDKTISLDLSFLPKNCKVRLLQTDGTSRNEVVEKTMTTKKSLEIHLNGYDGFVLYLDK